jgi:hypothetical protein
MDKIIPGGFKKRMLEGCSLGVRLEKVLATE